MSSDPRHEAAEQGTTEARIATLETLVNSLVTKLDHQSARLKIENERIILRRKIFSSRPRRFAALAVAVAVMLPLAALASDRFPDVPSSNVHHDNINAIADASISLGCAGGNYCPGDLVRRDQMGSFLARLGGLGRNLPVALAKSDSQTYCALAKRQPETFPDGPCRGVLRSVVDTPFGGAQYTSIAIGSDGNPVISYRDSQNGDLKVAKCASSECAGPATITTIDSLADVGYFTSIAISSGGNPIISYFDGDNQDLKIARCTNPACTASSVGALDTTGSAGGSTSIATAAGGNPVISYSDNTNAQLKVAKCLTPSCGGATLSVVDNVLGQYTSIGVGSDGNPVISYLDSGTNDLRVAKCVDPACSGAATVTLVDTAGSVGHHTSLAIGTDGNPVISYFDAVNQDLKIAKCANPACTGAATITTVDATGNVGKWTSIAIGTDGNPVVSYLDETNFDLKVARCGNPACTLATITSPDTLGTVGQYTSIAIGTDGPPIVSYWDFNNALKVARVPVNI